MYPTAGVQGCSGYYCSTSKAQVLSKAPHTMYTCINEERSKLVRNQLTMLTQTTINTTMITKKLAIVKKTGFLDKMHDQKTPFRVQVRVIAARSNRVKLVCINKLRKATKWTPVHYDNIKSSTKTVPRLSCVFQHAYLHGKTHSKSSNSIEGYTQKVPTILCTCIMKTVDL